MKTRTIAARLLLASCACSVLLTPVHAANRRNKQEISDRQTAADGRTVGWLIMDHDPNPGQTWRTFAQELVISRQGKVIRRFTTTSTYRGWTFWAGGREVAVQEGGLHGPTSCSLLDVASKRRVAVLEECDDEADKPDWAKAVIARAYSN